MKQLIENFVLRRLQEAGIRHILRPGYAVIGMARATEAFDRHLSEP